MAAVHIPKSKKKALRDGAAILYEDEAGFRQDSTLHQTWGRKGHQPEVPVTGQRKSIKVYGVVELGRTRFQHKFAGVLNAETYLSFLKTIKPRYSRCGAVLIQDNASFHKAPVIREWYEQNSAWLLPAFLPRYWPELNATERVWHHVRVNATHDRYFASFDDLVNTLEEMLEDIRLCPQQLDGQMAPFF